MHPRVKKSWDIAQELDLTRNEVARNMKVAFSAYDKWLKGNLPQRRSLRKIDKFIERAEAGENFKPTPKKEPAKVPLENISGEVRNMYAYIYYLEEKYGDLTKVADDDPVLKLLRAEADS